MAAQRTHASHVLVYAAVLAAVASACGNEGTPSALSPRGPEAGRIAVLWWLMLGLAGLVFLVVMGSLVTGIVRRRPASEEPGAERPGSAGHDEGVAPARTSGDRLSRLDRRFVVGGGVVMPAVILTLLGVLTVGAVDAVVKSESEFVVEVSGEQFWWDVQYPDLGFRTANEITIPAGTEITLRLTSPDVIHSFWVPELAGKRDLVPGRTNTLVFEADRPGVYRGQCAEYCGIQHANMALYVVALDPDEFESWADRRREGPLPPATAQQRRGREVLETEACAGCHRVQGTEATGTLGPDLTDVASRRTIGAGALPNDRGHLAGWILDAQSTKPGALMPPMDLAPDELDALLAYLETLR